MDHGRRPRLALVGGFLGAGKTTLLGQAARMLSQRGLRVGLITNDQATDLVDTGLLTQAGLDVAEVGGGCFCCRFDQVLSAATDLIDRFRPDILIGEPVGSCVDLSATVLQPLKEFHADRFHVTPFTVLVDAQRANEAIQRDAVSPFCEHVRYIMRKQVHEADVIVLNKTDLLTAEQLGELRGRIETEFPAHQLHLLSAALGDGVEKWLDTLLDGRTGGGRLAEVDYEVYAEGEARLGWLNASYDLFADSGVDWQAFCMEWLERLRQELRSRHVEIAHVKVLLKTLCGSYVGNLTSTRGVPTVRGVCACERPEAVFLVNARVEAEPEVLREAVEYVLNEVAGQGIEVANAEISSFSPTPPRPVHRFSGVVASG